MRTPIDDWPLTSRIKRATRAVPIKWTNALLVVLGGATASIIVMLAVWSYSPRVAAALGANILGASLVYARRLSHTA